MKILIIVTHPHLSESVVNKNWIAALEKHPTRFTVHHLDAVYTDGKINVPAEQALVEQYDNIVFQFPFYWFNCPPLLKQWLDEVLLYGWAYGSSSGKKMQGKKIALAISLGAEEADYQRSGKFKYSLAELTRPFELTFAYVHADYKGIFAQFSAGPESDSQFNEESAKKYLSFLEQL
ncbi:NAD(P)H-dependent oxidoreductase [Sphingobacterium thalpophilum]|uniref:General stress protein 14 n=1 Tax=Sphingobacterium thalpophilum TaxID=259 RepID=A0A4U9VLZ1_9SPHI|nr:NAD(P)H-dependent oxidoreductase [Sphingobacterium thalpophilum]VTR48240.1 General stress protein 14 [Sphingobacterium thalpophilum]